jgi:hypothetical protein
VTRYLLNQIELTDEQLSRRWKEQEGGNQVAHRVYSAIVIAVQSGALHEPFSKDGFREACPGLGPGTYNAFLDKHAKGNPGGNSELFARESPGSFRCLRPFRYGLGDGR